MVINLKTSLYKPLDYKDIQRLLLYTNGIYRRGERGD